MDHAFAVEYHSNVFVQASEQVRDSIEAYFDTIVTLDYSLESSSLVLEAQTS